MYSKTTGALGNGDLDQPLDIPYFTDMLRDAGYEIALVGKAHCRDSAKDRNCDYYFAYNAPGTNYYEPTYIEGRGANIGPPKTYFGYTDDIAMEKAIAWLEQPRDKPFCCCSGPPRRMRPTIVPAGTLIFTTASPFPSHPRSTTI